MMKRISFHIEEKLLELVDEYRTETRAEFIRKALIEEYYKRKTIKDAAENLIKETEKGK